MKYRQFLVYALAVVGAISLAVAPEPAETAEDPIIIGAAIAQTGWASAFDISATSGAEIAIEDINAAGGVLGRPLKLIKGDTKTDLTLGPKVATQLIDKGAVFLLVTCDFDAGAPQALVAQAKGLIAISVCSASAKWGDLVSVGDLAFTAGSSVNGEGAAAAEWAYNEMGWRTAWILTDIELVFNTGLAHGFEDRWAFFEDTELLGLETWRENTDVSIAPQITRLRGLEKQPDFIYVSSCPPGGASALRQIRSAGVDLPILATDCFDGTYWLDAVPELSNFHYLTYGSVYGDDENAKVNEFVAKFKKKTGKNPLTGHVLPGYSTVEAWAIAAERAGTIETKAVKAELEKFLNEPLLAGLTTWSDETHIASRDHALMRIEKGQPSFVKRIQASKVPPYRP